MEAETQVKLRSLEPYRHLFPAAKVKDQTMKKGAGVSDTVSFIPQVVEQCKWQVEKFVDQELRGLSLYDACEKLWYFVKYHIQYEKDERGKEQVRSPRRLIHDAKGDCDCFTTFIDTCLASYGVKTITNRITKYKQDFFQHIYPIVPMGNGKHIVMDCVVDQFNYEEPYTEKEDYKMDLQFLDGIDGNRPSKLGIDAHTFSSGMGGEIGELGKLLRNRNGNGRPSSKKGLFHKRLFQKKTAEQKTAIKQKHKEKRKEVVKKTLKVVNKVNKVNPATALLRAGILASMKLNVMKVPEKLKWAYASRELAQSKGMDMHKYDKLKNVLAKIEQIFYAAGGKPENLRHAILTGKGNRGHEVAGLDDNTPLPELLGGVYNDELVSGMEGFQGFGGLGDLGQLGEPATATALAAASTTMGTLAVLLKTIGDLFPKQKKESKKERGIFKRKNSDSGQGGSNSEDNESEAVEESGVSEEEESSGETQESNEEQSSEEKESEPSPEEREDDANLPAVNQSNEVAVNDNGEGGSGSEESTDGLSGVGIKAFWTNNKKWIVPVGLGTVVLGGVLIYAANKKEDQSPKVKLKAKQAGLNGIPKKKKPKQKKKGGSSAGHIKKSLIALM